MNTRASSAPPTSRWSRRKAQSANLLQPRELFAATKDGQGAALDSDARRAKLDQLAGIGPPVVVVVEPARPAARADRLHGKRLNSDQRAVALGRIGIVL